MLTTYLYLVLSAVDKSHFGYTPYLQVASNETHLYFVDVSVLGHSR